MRDASLVTCRNTSCVVDPLSMTARSSLPGRMPPTGMGVFQETAGAVSCQAGAAARHAGSLKKLQARFLVKHVPPRGMRGLLRNFRTEIASL
jgi:hypothetical protein